MWDTTFMSKAFEESHIIQPQHLTDVHVIRKNSQFICHIFEEKVVFSKRRGVEEMEAPSLSPLLTKQHLNNNKQSNTNVLIRWKSTKQSDICG